MKRILVLAALAVFAVFSLSACPDSSDAKQGTSKAGAKTRKTLDAIDKEANK